MLVAPDIFQRDTRVSLERPGNLLAVCVNGAQLSQIAEIPVTALAGGALMVALAWRLRIARAGADKAAMQLFALSILYLLTLFAVLLTGVAVRVFRRTATRSVQRRLT